MDKYMMTSSNGTISRVTGTLWGESTGDRWIPLTEASDAELWSRVMMFSLVCAQTNGWANNRDADDFRPHRAHYDVPVMNYIRMKCEVKWFWSLEMDE